MERSTLRADLESLLKPMSSKISDIEQLLLIDNPNPEIAKTLARDAVVQADVAREKWDIALGRKIAKGNP